MKPTTASATNVSVKHVHRTKEPTDWVAAQTEIVVATDARVVGVRPSYRMENIVTKMMTVAVRMDVCLVPAVCRVIMKVVIMTVTVPVGDVMEISLIVHVTPSYRMEKLVTRTMIVAARMDVCVVPVANKVLMSLAEVPVNATADDAMVISGTRYARKS